MSLVVLHKICQDVVVIGSRLSVSWLGLLVLSVVPVDAGQVQRVHLLYESVCNGLPLCSGLAS